MSSKPPFQLVTVRDEGDAEMSPFDEAIVRAFEGGIAIGGYLATGEDLGIEVKAFRKSVALQKDIATLLDEACHTLVIALAGEALASNTSLLGLVEECWNHARASKGRHSVLVIAQDDRVGKTLLKAAAALKTNQLVTAEQLGERAVRPAMAALRSLHETRKLLAEGMSSTRSQPSTAFLRLFISHAKLDGLPLAQSLKHQIDEISWLKSFYDARDLADEADWEHALEAAAMSSTLVILRTDAYEGRPWCRQEALWAEEAAAPTVLVEARPGLAYPSGELPLERMPSVRIPDGNLLRILYAALRENLRYLLFQRRIREMQAAGWLEAFAEVRAFSYPPSMSALMRACSEFQSSPALIMYPDPPLRRGVHEAATALVQQLAREGGREVRLATPETLATAPKLP